MDYKVLQDNFGFKSKWWMTGEIVSLDDDEIPPTKWFLPLSKAEKESEVKKPIPKSKAKK